MLDGIGGWVDQHLLTALIFSPIASLLVPMMLEAFGWRLSVTMWKGFALIVSLVGLGLGIEVWRRFDATVGSMQMVEHSTWISGYGINYYVGIDGISLFLVVLAAFLLPIILIASWVEIAKRVKQYIFFMMLLQTGMLGAFLSLNLFLFYVFWEVMLIPMYFVIGIWGGPGRLYATVKFFIYTMLGSLLMLVGILVLVFLHYQQFPGDPVTFDYIGFAGAPGIIDTPIPTEGQPWWQNQSCLFLLFGLSFAIKVPVFPFHTWLPDAHVEAPTAGSVVLAGVLLKLGTYGFLRYSLPLFPVATIDLAPWVLGLAVIGIIYGALVAMVQQDIKRLVAYASVSHLGFVMLGLFALNLQGLEGALLQMVNHGLSTGALFLLVGMLYQRRHVRDIAEFGGLARVMPTFTAFFVITTMASIGLPLLNGFVGEFLILIGIFAVSPLVAVLATSGIILSAVYMLWMVRRVFFGPLLHDVNRKLVDLGLREKLVATAMVVPMIWIGIYPSSFLRPMDRSLSALLRKMEARGADIAAYQGLGESSGRASKESTDTSGPESGE